MKDKLFVIIILTIFQYTQSYNLNESVADIICKSFGQIKCPSDNYCVEEDKACRYCPSGSDKDCPDNARNPRFYGKCNLKDRYKYYYKYYDACNERLDCPINTTNHDEDGCDSDSKCKEKTYGRRKIKCPNETRCVEYLSECDNCKTEFGGNEHKCNETYCASLKATFIDEQIFGSHQTYRKCPESPKCILKGQFCDGKIDCPNKEDERNCTKEDCNADGKIKCPFQDKCIDKEIACSDTYTGKYPQNQCWYNLDCVESCLFKSESHMLCPKSATFERKQNWMKENCLPLGQKCIADPLLVNILNLTKNHLWRCSHQRNEYISIRQVCDGKFDCLQNEDESDNVCRHFPLEMAVNYSLCIVLGLATIAIATKSFNLFIHPLMCIQCLEKCKCTILPEEWFEKQRLLTQLLGTRNKEFFTSRNSKGLVSTSFQAYLAVHDTDAPKKKMSNLFYYISHRLDEKLSYKNLDNLMMYRNKIYKDIFTYELVCHKGFRVNQ